jgi:hypothetical protein
MGGAGIITHVITAGNSLHGDFHGEARYKYVDGQVDRDPADRNRVDRERPRFWLGLMSQDESKDRVERFLVSRSAEGSEPAQTVTTGEIAFPSNAVAVSVDGLSASRGPCVATGGAVKGTQSSSGCD